jgi:hypothetical protein
VIGTHVFENHPRWEAEVVEIRPITPGPVRLGSRAVMVRQEGRRRLETPYEVTRFEPDRAIAFRHDPGPIDFELRLQLRPVGEAETELTVDVEMVPHGALRLASPLMALQMPGRTDRITRRMVALVESGAGSPRDAVAAGSAVAGGPATP